MILTTFSLLKSSMKTASTMKLILLPLLRNNLGLKSATTAEAKLQTLAPPLLHHVLPPQPPLRTTTNHCKTKTPDIEMHDDDEEEVQIIEPSPTAKDAQVTNTTTNLAASQPSPSSTSTPNHPTSLPGHHTSPKESVPQQAQTPQSSVRQTVTRLFTIPTSQRRRTRMAQSPTNYTKSSSLHQQKPYQSGTK